MQISFIHLLLTSTPLRHFVSSCVIQYPILSFLTRKKSLASNFSFSSNYAPSISYCDDDIVKGKIVQGRFDNKHFSVDDGAEEQKFTSGGVGVARHLGHHIH